MFTISCTPWNFWKYVTYVIVDWTLVQKRQVVMMLSSDMSQMITIKCINLMDLRFLSLHSYMMSLFLILSWESDRSFENTSCEFSNKVLRKNSTLEEENLSHRKVWISLNCSKDITMNSSKSPYFPKIIEMKTLFVLFSEKSKYINQSPTDSYCWRIQLTVTYLQSAHCNVFTVQRQIVIFFAVFIVLRRWNVTELQMYLSYWYSTHTRTLFGEYPLQRELFHRDRKWSVRYLTIALFDRFFSKVSIRIFIQRYFPPPWSSVKMTMSDMESPPPLSHDHGRSPGYQDYTHTDIFHLPLNVEIRRVHNPCALVVPLSYVSLNSGTFVFDTHILHHDDYDCITIYDWTVDQESQFVFCHSFCPYSNSPPTSLSWGMSHHPFTPIRLNSSKMMWRRNPVDRSNHPVVRWK